MREQSSVCSHLGKVPDNLPQRKAWAQTRRATKAALGKVCQVTREMGNRTPLSVGWSLNMRSAGQCSNRWVLGCGMRGKGQMGAVGKAGLEIPFVAKEASQTICKKRVLISGTL